MRIGVVIPAFNIAPYIGDAVRSLLAQTHQDWTTTIVDDGSTDRTASVVAEFHDPRIHLVRQRNAGVSSARNRGVAETHADALIFLDGDDWLSPDAIDKLATALYADPCSIASVGPYARVPGRGAVSLPASGYLLERLLVQNLFANGGHLLVHSEILRAAGPFHPGLRFGEDWEYWSRLARFGPFAATVGSAPILFVRERSGSAYFDMALTPASFTPCMDAIFNAPALEDHLSNAKLAKLRRRAVAENEWIIGRELIRHGREVEGRKFLIRSVRETPSLRRLTLVLASFSEATRVGPLRAY